MFSFVLFLVKLRKQTKSLTSLSDQPFYISHVFTDFFFFFTLNFTRKLLKGKNTDLVQKGTFAVALEISKIIHRSVPTPTAIVLFHEVQNVRKRNRKTLNFKNLVIFTLH